METKVDWIICPVCDRKAQNKIQEDTVLENFPLYCPKCRQEMLVDVKGLVVSVCKDSAK